MYFLLAGRGDQYATLAHGVTAGDTFAGQMALVHLDRTASEQGYLLRALVCALTVCLCLSLLGCEQSEPTKPDLYVDLYGVVLHIPDREAQVLPSNYLSKEERSKEIGRASNLTLCTKYPDFHLYGDAGSRASCLAIGKTASPWLMLDISGTAQGFMKEPPRYPTSSFGRILELHRDYQGLGRGSARGIIYAEGQDNYGLHSFLPTGSKARPESASFFWSGPNASTATTLIRCVGHTPQETKVYKTCTHKFFISFEKARGERLLVTIDYHDSLLSQWQAIEDSTRTLVISLQSNPYS